jgi:hypothetical protein
MQDNCLYIFRQAKQGIGRNLWQQEGPRQELLCFNRADKKRALNGSKRILAGHLGSPHRTRGARNVLIYEA